MAASFRRTSSFNPQVLAEHLLNGDRVSLSRSITLVESKRPEDHKKSLQLLELIKPHTGNSLRIGITGVPGVGKSTFIESFGKQLTSIGKKVAVLSIDPSSGQTRGSILGDKTRMNELSMDPMAFIRPSASGSYLGGVGSATRESILLCEAAGFEIILVETVGVGQSETQVKDMVDYFLLLMLAGGGDDLQGIKRGIMEMADHILINKADGENKKMAKKAREDYKNAIHLFPATESGWTIPVQLCSALNKEGLDSFWEQVLNYEKQMRENGFLAANRINQEVKWFHEQIKQKLIFDFFSKPNISAKIKERENAVSSQAISVRKAIDSLFN